MTKSVCNYFSFGYESRVGFGMEKHRKSNLYLNLMEYGKQGILKCVCQPPPRVKDVVLKGVEHMPDGSTRTIFQLDPNKKEEPYLKFNPVVMAMINTTTMGRGAKLWNRTYMICSNKRMHDHVLHPQLEGGPADLFITMIRFLMLS